MPKSKHRPKPKLSKHRLEVYEQTERNKAVRRRTYERALPEYQEYPPFTRTSELITPARREIINRVLAKAEERRQRRLERNKRLAGINLKLAA
jgi:hypothetical protein